MQYLIVPVEDVCGDPHGIVDVFWTVIVAQWSELGVRPLFIVSLKEYEHWKVAVLGVESKKVPGELGTVAKAVGPVGAQLVSAELKLVKAAATGELSSGIIKNIAIKPKLTILNLTFDLHFK